MSRRGDLDIWYPRYPGKYARKTATLSLAEHGAYALLMDFYYVNGPLPLDWVHLHRICKALAPTEQEAVHNVVGRYFKQTVDGWINDRAEEELKKRSEISDKRRAAQAERERRRTCKTGRKTGALAPTDTDTGIEDKSSIRPHGFGSTLSTPEIDMQFQSFWNAYPGMGKDGATGTGFKGSRAKALESFNKLLRQQKGKEDYEIIVGSLNRGAAAYAEHLARSGYPSKHAVTWLNQRGWEDDYSGTGPRAGAGGATKSDRAKAALLKSAEDLGIT